MKAFIDRKIMRITHLNRSLTTKLLAAIFVPLLFAIATDAGADTPTSNPDISQAVSAIVESKHHPLLVNADFSAQSLQLSNLYQANDFQLLWFATPQAQSNIETALALLANAGADGLDAKNYDADTLKQQIQIASSLPPNAATEL
ncbi:MAG: hypothetical protein PHH11_17345, partial [Methylomonas sp.]|nr:hypothetical protein [Methylomonas sp.]